MKKILTTLFSWVFKQQLNELKIQIQVAQQTCDQLKADSRKLHNLLDNLDISVDHHEYSSSWAVISIQGQQSDFIKFIDLGRSDIHTIQQFLRQFDRSKVDCSPQASKFFKL